MEVAIASTMSFLSTSDCLVDNEYEINNNLKLRLLRINDATACFALISKNRKHLGEFLSWVSHIKELNDEIAYINESMLRIKEGKKLEFGIFLKIILENEAKWELIGMCAFVLIKDGCGNLGYWLNKHHVGKGIVTSACTCLIKKTAQKIGLTRIVSHVSPKNIKSIRTLERLGFTTDNVISKVDLYGAPEDMLLYVCPNDKFN